MNDSARQHSDSELLGRFAARRDEQAFRALVERYVNLVFSSALRRTGDASLAEEISQNVFMLLAKKARSLTSHPTLGGWLVRTAANESMRLSRNEQTRKRRMKVYQEHYALTSDLSPEDRTAWGEAMPLLDEALASLNESDRDALVLRFYEKRNFKAIAGLLGKSDDACQKQVSRAVEKLSQWFGRRGVVLPSALVLAGLGASLSETQVNAHATGLAAQLSAKALGAAHLVPATGTAMLITLMKTKLMTISFILAALAASAGGGWLAGISQQDSVGVPVDSNSATNLPSLIPGANTVEEPVANEAREASLARLLQLARRELAGHETEKGARVRASARISLIQPEDFPRAADLIANFDGGTHRHRELFGVLLEEWAGHDGPAACAFALERLHNPMMGIQPVSHPLRAWASQDPRAAMDWFQKRKTEKGKLGLESFGGFASISEIRWIMGAWGLSDPSESARVYRQLETRAERQGARIGFMEGARRSTDRAVLLDAVWETPERGDQPPADEVRTILSDWAAYQPAELAAWIDSKDVARSNRNMVSKDVLAGWLTLDRDAAIDWWMGRIPEGGKRSSHLSRMVEAWTTTDIFGAAEWLAAQDLTEEHSRAVSSLSQKLVHRDVERGFAWAAAVPEGASRERALKHAYSTWHRSDPEAAKTALKAADLDKELRIRLEEAAEQAPPPAAATSF